MLPENRHLRADAERNRRRLLDAAAAAFCERGLDVGVAEIAQRAGVGRGTLFRHFPTKDALIAAIVAQRMREAAARGRTLAEAQDPGAALFEFMDALAGRQQLDRALFEAVADTWLANPEIRAAHTGVVEVLEQLLTRAQEAGAVRADVGAMDVLMLLKGVCEVAGAFSQIDAGLVERQLDLMRSALSVPGPPQPLRGRTPTVEDIERAFAVSEQRPPSAERV
jgi:AcrR family transcriptional regulator